MFFCLRYTIKLAILMSWWLHIANSTNSSFSYSQQLAIIRGVIIYLPPGFPETNNGNHKNVVFTALLTNLLKDHTLTVKPSDIPSSPLSLPIARYASFPDHSFILHFTSNCISRLGHSKRTTIVRRRGGWSSIRYTDLGLGWGFHLSLLLTS